MNTSLLSASRTPPPPPPVGVHAETGPTPAATLPRVLVVDDEKIIADTIAQILNGNGFTAEAVYSGDQAIAKVREQCPNLVLTDVMMPVLDGIEASIAIRDICSKIRIVLFTGNATTSHLLDSARERGHNFELLAKPLHPDKLIEHLRDLA